MLAVARIPQNEGHRFERREVRGARALVAFAHEVAASEVDVFDAAGAFRFRIADDGYANLARPSHDNRRWRRMRNVNPETYAPLVEAAA